MGASPQTTVNPSQELYSDIPIFVTNLPNSSDRRASITNEMKGVGVDFKFIDAVIGKELDLDNTHYNRKKRLKYFGRDLTPGEVGCMLSHRKVYQKMVSENIDQAIIFEDDIIFRNADFISILEALKTTNREWDVIRFLDPKHKCRQITPVTGDYKLARLYGTQGGGHGYMLNLKAAKILLEHTKYPYLPIDTILGRTWETGLKVPCLFPAPVGMDLELESTIGDKRFEKIIQLNGWERRLYPLYRALFKLHENIFKFLSYWIL